MSFLAKTLLLLASLVTAAAALAGPVTANFDALDTSGGDTPVPGAYLGLDWTNFTAYTTTPGFAGFNNGIVSPFNAAYSGGETSGTDVAPVVGSITSAGLFDLNSADLGAGYYDALQLTVEGSRGGAVLYTRTVTLDTTGAKTFDFSFTGIDALTFATAATPATTDPFACGIFNCTQFTMDNVQINAVPELSTLATWLTGLFALAVLRLWTGKLSLARTEGLTTILHLVRPGRIEWRSDIKLHRLIVFLCSVLFTFQVFAAPSGAPRSFAAGHVSLSKMDWPNGRSDRPGDVAGMLVQREAGRAAPLSAFTVYLDKEIPLVGYTQFNQDCSYAGAGSFSAPTTPQHGVLRYGEQTFPIPSGPCAGVQLPYTIAYYTWTDGAATPGTTDNFSLHFAGQGTNMADTSWTASLTDRLPDAGATGPADTTNVSGCQSPKAQANSSTAPGTGTNVQSPQGCTVWSVAPLTVSLTLHDIPLAYRPPRGPTVDFELFYSHRDVQQPATFNYGNLGPKWTTTWLSYVTDTVAAQSKATLYGRGGGAETYSYPSGTATTSQPGPYSEAVLTRTVGTNGATASFTRQLKDGSVELFGQVSGTRFFMTAVIDPQGNRVTLTYDAQLRLTRLTDAVGRATLIAYSTTDTLKIVRVTDPFGRFAGFTYNPQGQLASITDTIGLTSSFTYGAGGFVNALRTPYGTTTFGFGDATTNPALGSTRYLLATDPLGQTSRVEYNERAPGVPQTAPAAPTGMAVANTQLDQRNTYIWNPVEYRQATAGGGLDYTKAKIIHWLRGPDGTTVSRVMESTKEPLEGRVWFDYAGQPEATTLGVNNLPLHTGRVLDDGSTKLTSYQYNLAGNPTLRIDPVGRKTVFAYDATGIDLITVQQQTSTGGTLSTIASFTYNTQHLPLSSTDAAGQTTQYAYNAAGQPLTMTNPLNQTTTYTYDTLGRLSATINANGVTQLSQTFDGFDRPATRTDSEGYTLAYSYDAFDRVTEIRYPDGTTTQNGYDKLDLGSVKDRLGRVTGYGHDANRRLTLVTDPLGQKTAYGYYEDGSLASLTDPKGNVTRWDIDLQGRAVAKHYANGNTETYAYEVATSRLKSIKDALNQVKIFGYTRDDRTASLQYSTTVNPTPNVSFNYDAFFPRVTAMLDGIGTTTWRYQPVGALGALQLAVEDGPYNNDTIAYAYDALGRVATRTVDTATESFGYDAIGRTTAHNSALGSFTRTYLGQTGQLTSQTTGIVGTAWSYDTNAHDRRLLAITNSGQARSFGFATTPENRITGITESVAGTPQRSWTYSYDDLDRLTKAQPSAGSSYGYGYDPVSNLTSINGIAATYNGANQIATLGSTTIFYDANGNLINDGARVYRWDAENRLIGISYATQTGGSTAFRYDGTGRRLSLSESAAGSEVETRYVWCGQRLCQSRSSAEIVTRRYFNEGVIVPQSGQALYYGVDQLGSTRDVMTVQSGTKVSSVDYDPYGNQITSVGRAALEFYYSNMYFHGRSGLYLTRYRPYDPRTGRWITRDPLNEAADLNLFSYSMASPVSRKDPNGLESVEVGGYDIVGGTITVGRDNQTGQVFVRIKAGLGAGISVGKTSEGVGGNVVADPDGNGDDAGCSDISTRPGISAGAFIEGGVSKGAVNVGASSGITITVHNGDPYDPIAHPFTTPTATPPQVSVDPPTAGITVSPENNVIKAEISAGLQITLMGKGNCPCRR